jgi:hypothetical protein
MTYKVQSQLVADAEFQMRCQAVFTEQAFHFKDDGRGDMAALANKLLMAPNVPLAGSSSVPYTFINLLAASPGFADEVDNGDGTIDSSKITDGELLSATQAQWPTVASLFYNPDGTPKL